MQFKLSHVDSDSESWNNSPPQSHPILFWSQDDLWKLVSDFSLGARYENLD